MIKKITLYLSFTLISIQSYSQEVTTNIFNDLDYASSNNTYEAHLKKDIFDDLLFSDSHNNQVTYKKEYLCKVYGKHLTNKEEKISFFMQLINRYKQLENETETYAIDVFGNKTYNGKNNSKTVTIKRKPNGDIVYNLNQQSAVLKMNIFNVWEYHDSLGNKIEFSMTTWKSFKRKYHTEENILSYLANHFLVPLLNVD
ncbi:hypothetical protein ACG2LH_11360 [Zhouia sp. PK063]|uniref:hypothetical protein n=1 Tax=Zhouia sp. PK063 TaxID=3373602 RepID=UPI0037AB6FBA